jgi:curved DNA-binding protein CbpA
MDPWPATLDDHYSVLGVPRSASAAAIKSAYRRAALRTHPDTSGGAPGSRAAFQRLGEAYAVLGDAAARCVYDAAHPWAGGAPAAPADAPPAWARAGGGGGGVGAGWARARAGSAAWGAPPPPDEAFGSGGAYVDHDAHRQAHYGPSPAEREAWLRARVRAARSGGGGGGDFAGGDFARGGAADAEKSSATWAYRRTLRERAAAWERAHGAAAAEAAAGDSEGAFYRRFASAFRAQQAAAARGWHWRVAAWAAASATLLLFARAAAGR